MGKHDEMAQAAGRQERHLPPERGCTGRVRKLRQEVLTSPWEVCIERARCYTDVYKSSPEQPIQVQRALAFRKTLEETPIRIYPGELLVGHRTSKRVGVTPLPRGEADLDRERARSLLLARASAVSRLRRRQGDAPLRDPPVLAEQRGEGSLQRAASSRGGEGPGGGGVRPRERVLQWGGTLLPRLPDAGGAGAHGNREQDRRAAGRARSHHSRRGREAGSSCARPPSPATA